MAKTINSFSLHLKATNVADADPDNWAVDRVGTNHVVGDTVATGATHPKTGDSEAETLSAGQKGAKDTAGTLLKLVQDCKSDCETAESLPSGNKEIQQFTCVYDVDCSDTDPDNWVIVHTHCDHFVGDSTVVGVRYPKTGECAQAILTSGQMGAKDVAGNFLKYAQDTKAAIEAAEGIGT